MSKNMDTLNDAREKFNQGKVVERWSENDFLGLLKQLGVIPEAA